MFAATVVALLGAVYAATLAPSVTLWDSGEFLSAVRTLGVTEQTYYRWRAEYGGLKLDQVKRLKLLEQENGRLRKAVADLTLEKLVLKEAASGNW